MQCKPISLPFFETYYNFSSVHIWNRNSKRTHNTDNHITDMNSINGDELQKMTTKANQNALQ